MAGGRPDPRYVRQLPPDIRAFYEGKAGGGGSVPGRTGMVEAGPDPRDLLGPPDPPLASAGVDISLLPPTWLRPPMAKDFHQDTDLAAAPAFNAGNTPDVIAGCEYTVPEGFFGVIRSLELNVNGLLASSRIEWSVRFDGMPVEGWAPLSIFPGNIAAARRSFGPEELQLHVPEASHIDVQINVLDAGTYTAGASFGGWIYTRSIDEVFRKVWSV